MSSNIRIVSGNSLRASLNSPAWDYLLELAPDIALLQDFRSVPTRVLDVYSTAPAMRSALKEGKA